MRKLFHTSVITCLHTSVITCLLRYALRVRTIYFTLFQKYTIFFLSLANLPCCRDADSNLSKFQNFGHFVSNYRHYHWVTQQDYQRFYSEALTATIPTTAKGRTGLAQALEFVRPCDVLIQHRVQTLIKWMPWRGGQLRMRHPQISCRSRCCRLPIAMNKVYETYLCILINPCA